MRIKQLFLTLALLCAIVQGAWAQASLDEVYAMTNTTAANWTQLSDGSTTGKTLGTANATTYYYADANLTFTNTTAGGSGLTIQGTVYLYVPEGVTLTCTGANADGQTGAGAGIELTEGNTLYLLGSGTLNATGGKAANGGNGTNGSDASCKWDDMEWAWVGGNGHGGNGGGGAGAGIGTCGGTGGAGGNAPEPEIYYTTWTENGVAGSAGSAGQTAGAKGELHVSKDITINATGGSQGSAGTAGSAGKSCMRYGSREYSIPGGGGGGAGGFGGAANNIGPGGPGGGGGGGGAKGSHDRTSTGFYIIYANGGGGGQNGDGSYAASGGTAGVSTANINNGTCETNDLDWVQEEKRGKESSGVNTTTNGGAGGACGTSIINDVVSSETTTMTSGTYTVLFDVTVQSRIQISGNVTLNLGEGAMLTANKGIEVSNGNSLTINGPGALTVPGAELDKAGIGALRVGTLTINGGTIDVTGGEQAAGIGGDCENRDGGTIIINGGVVTAKGLKGGAGIGGGSIGGWHAGCGRCGTVVINGGQVTAIGYGGAAGIGPGHIPGVHTYTNEGGSLTIGWTRLTDFVYSSGYSNNDNLGLSSIVFADGKRFMIEETGVGATSGNIAGKKIVPIPETELSGSGAENDPYLINDPDDWYLLFAKIAQGTSYSGKFVQLNSDISVSTMVGISETNSFQGTFLGEGHTITAAMTDNINGGAAPFRYIKNATIKNLTVAGTITSNQRHMSGLVGFADSEGEGKNLIEDCTVTATLNVNTDYAGGIIGHGKSSATTIRGCVFAGTMNSNSDPNVGVIWGWSDSATPTLENSLEAGTYTGISKLHPMGLQKAAGTITNCYYTTPHIGSPENACTVSGARQAYALATTPANLGNLVKDYGLAKAYQNGILYGGTYYVIPRALTGSGTEESPYIIDNDYDWNCFAYSVTNGTSYSGEFVKLNSDISVSTMAGASETNSFQGTFLGGGHTITAAMTDNINGGAAPFRYIKNATIKNLTVAGTITSNQRHMSGLVGFADSEGEGKNLIEDCTVTATLNVNTDYAGGIIGHGKSSATTIRGCVFAGTMNSNSDPNVGVIWGWSDSATPTLENSLEAGTYTGISKLHPMGLQKAAGTITNCYYTTPQIGSPENACTVSGANQAYAFVSAPPNLGNLEHNYGTMTVYENGILFGGIYYVASTTVSLADNADNSTTISGANGYFADVTLTDRTLYNDGKWNTLCLPFNLDSFTDTPLEGATVKTLASTSFTGGTLTMNFSDDVTSIEAGKPYIVKWEYNVVDLSTLTANYTAQDGETLTGTLGGNYKISIADGATVKLQDVTINGENTKNCLWAGINCSGDATIFLKGTNTVRGFYENYSGIYVPSGSTLTIKGSGSLNASSNGYGAGIGGGYRISCGNIVIEGGTINATGGEYAAGIGGGYQTSCGTITITDGVTKVTATKGNSAPNSIGAGEECFCRTVTVGGVEGAIVNNHTYTGTGSGSVDVASILPDFVNPVFSGVIISKGTANVKTDYVDFIGTYSPVSIYTNENTNLYLGADNKLYYPTASDFTVNAFRGYFLLKEELTSGKPSNSQQAGVRAFKLNFGDGETTGIEAIDNLTIHNSQFEADAWYTLDGRKLDGKPMARGLYINNGKKVVIK